MITRSIFCLQKMLTVSSPERRKPLNLLRLNGFYWLRE